MSEHYYTENPTVEHDEKTVIFEVLGEKLTCTTDSGVFSRDGLDMGTRVMLEALPEISVGTTVLDLGCGWGPVGTAVGKKYPGARITMTDINTRAVELSMRNLKANGVCGASVFTSDGFEGITGKFDMILLNPPIRTGKAVIYGMFEKAKDYLNDGGSLYIVIRKQQGAESADKYLKTIYGSVERVSREKGYWVLKCIYEGEKHV